MLFVAEPLAAPASQSVADVARMAHGDGIAAGDHAHKRLAECRGNREQRAFKQTAEQDGEETIAEASGYEDDGSQAGYIEHSLASQEDVLKLREAGQRDVDQHADEHDHRRYRAIIHQSNGDYGLIARHNTLNTERELEHLCKWI